MSMYVGWLPIKIFTFADCSVRGSKFIIIDMVAPLSSAFADRLIWHFYLDSYSFFAFCILGKCIIWVWKYLESVNKTILAKIYIHIKSKKATKKWLKKCKRSNLFKLVIYFSRSSSVCGVKHSKLIRIYARRMQRSIIVCIKRWHHHHI